MTIDRSTTEILKRIGIPGIIDGRITPDLADDHLMQIAHLNKVDLLYSNATRKSSQDLASKYNMLIQTLKSLGKLFNDNEIDYVVFKTIKPYPSTPSDVDVLISKESLDKAIELLEDLGYRKLASDTFSTTMSLDTGMIVDLQLQPSVLNMPYLSKKMLMEHVITKQVDGIDIRTLDNKAEIVAVASHSFYKELIFTLNDYYTITMLMQLQSNLEEVIDLCDRMQATDALRYVLSLCKRITDEVFARDLKVCEASRRMGSARLEEITTPLKFPANIVIRSFIIRAYKDRLIRNNILPALIAVSSPRKFRRLISHLQRETY